MRSGALPFTTSAPFYYFRPYLQYPESASVNLGCVVKVAALLRELAFGCTTGFPGQLGLMMMMMMMMMMM